MPPDLMTSVAAATVVVFADWPALSPDERAWLVELCVGSLGWGSRFGEEFAPVIIGPDSADDALPSGVAMYTAARAEAGGVTIPADARVIVVIGPVDDALTTIIRRSGLPVIRMVQSPAITAEDWCVRDAAALVDTVFALQAEETPTRAVHAAARVAPAPTAPATIPASDTRVSFEPPPVSIIIPSYNRAGYLRETIASCLAQEYPHCRILVTDDGSSDGTADMVGAMDPARVRLLRNPHGGGPANRNRALATVDTPFILWIGDDDLLVPGVVKSRIAMLEQYPDADVIHGDTLVCNATLEPQNVIAGEEWYHRPEALLATLFQRNVMADGGSLIRMSVFARAGWYDPSYPKGHDYHLWSRVALRARFKHDPGIGALWRWHGSNMGLGGGTNPYADAHRRIVLEMWTRYDRRLLFPDVAWDTIPAAQHDAVSALLLAQRLVREEAWDDAIRFGQLAVTLGIGAQAESFVATLRARAAAAGHG